MTESINCIFGLTLDKAVMSYDAFIYLLLRLATDDDADSFRCALETNPTEVLEKAGHEINVANLGVGGLVMPSKEETRMFLRDYLLDYDGGRTLPRGGGRKPPLPAETLP